MFVGPYRSGMIGHGSAETGETPIVEGLKGIQLNVANVAKTIFDLATRKILILRLVTNVANVTITEYSYLRFRKKEPQANLSHDVSDFIVFCWRQ